MTLPTPAPRIWAPENADDLNDRNDRGTQITGVSDWARILRAGVSQILHLDEAADSHRVLGKTQAPRPVWSRSVALLRTQWD